MRRGLEKCNSILDVREYARSSLPGPIFDFLDGAAETERTALRNTAAFDEIAVVPRCLVDVGVVKTSTRILGQEVAWPVMCSPTGASRLFHPDGELAVARAASRAGMLYGVSTGSTYTLEEIAAAGSGPKMFQLYLHSDRDMTRELIRRCKQSGYVAICLTVDVPVVGKRERDLRSGFSMDPRWSVSSFISFARHPRWVAGQMRKGAVYLANLEAAPPKGFFTRPKQRTSELDPTVTWKDVREISDLWNGPFAIKGIMSVEDACRATDAGVTAIIVSNHGGRQLDGAAAPIEVLRDIVRAVQGRAEVILDGGIRRGVHVLKALACGASACSIGRPYLYGLSAGGEAGVTKAINILQTEFIRAMQLAGCQDLYNIDASRVKQVSWLCCTNPVS